MADPVKSLIQLLTKNKGKKKTENRAKQEPSIDDSRVVDNPALVAEADGFEGTVTRDDYVYDDNDGDSPIKSWSAAIGNANLQLLFNGLLSIALVACLMVIFNQKPTVIMKPPVMLGDIKIENGLPNADWKRSWALFFSSTVGNVTPRNVEFVSKVITSFMVPAIQDANTSRIRQLTQIMKMRGVTQEFAMQDISYDEVSDLVWVWGYKTTKTNHVGAGEEDEAEDRRKWTFEMLIKPTETGTPQITYLDQYEGTPRYENANNVKNGVVMKPAEDSKKKTGKGSK